jgi:phenylacetate-CoA ligase
VLFSRTLPLIRYELTDRIKISTATCRCGLPFRLIEAVEGRTDDVLSLPARTGGLVRLHPVIFHKTLDLIDAAGWQVRQHRAGLRILVASPGPGFESAATEHAVRAAVVAAGASTPKVTVSVVGDIPSGAAGKRPLVVASPQSDAQGPDAPPP